jgi:hypothetical protein
LVLPSKPTFGYLFCLCLNDFIIQTYQILLFYCEFLLSFLQSLF